MSLTQFLAFSGVAIAWIAIVFRGVKCRHPHEKCSLPMGAYGLDKMVGIQKCFACGAERFYRHGLTGDVAGEWFYRKYQRSGK